MGMLYDCSVLAGIILIFLLLFSLPFLFIILKIYKSEPLIGKIYISTILGLFVSIIITIILATSGIFTPISFIITYLFIVIIANYYFLRKSILVKFKQVGYFCLQLPKMMGKSIKHSPILLLIVPALLVGFYLRLNYAFTHIALPSIDPYGHLLVSKILAAGDLLKPIGYYDDGARGFHVVTTLVHFYSNIEMYSIIRFMGGFLGVFSIGSIYYLTSSLKDRTAGCFAALIYAGAAVVPEISVLSMRQTQSIPEVMALVILPIAILAVYKFMAGADFKSQIHFIFLAAVAFIIIMITHPLTAMIAIYIIVLIAMINVISSRRIKIVLVIIILGILIVILSHPAVANIFQFYVIEWGELLAGLFELKGSTIPTASTFIIIELAILYFTYGALTKQKNIIFISSTCLLFAFIETTGILMMARLPLERILIFFAIPVAVMIGMGISEILGWFDKPKLSRWIAKYKLPLKLNKSKIRAIVTVIFIALLLVCLPPKPPSLAPFGFEDSIEAALAITEDYPERDTVIYSEKVFMINRERAIIEPEGMHFELHELIKTSPVDFTPDKKYTFIFIEKRNMMARAKYTLESNQSVRVMDIAKRWVDEYQMYHNNMEIYYDTKNLRVYLIESQSNN
ncbi:MAG: hypothetical protein JSV49_01205 [Thermoplasmata archaeon]|nr:MAG: hypothetical protein JSV49_01205 [Thermoplasmata archaeon]